MTVSFTLSEAIQLFVDGRVVSLGSGNHEIDETIEPELFEQLRQVPPGIFNLAPLLPGEAALPAAPPSDLIYVGTFAQVNEANTAGLLASQFSAIWCPPPRLIPWHGTPRPGSRVWLAWRQNGPGDALSLLGGGRLRSVLLFNNASLPGVRTFAHQQCGYPNQPTNMTFLQLVTPAVLQAPFPNVAGVNPAHNGLNDLTQPEAAILNGMLPIP